MVAWVAGDTSQDRKGLSWEGPEFALGCAVFAVLVKRSGGNVKPAVRSVYLGIRRDLDIKETGGN